MANWPLDPLPHVPSGFTLQEPAACPPLRHEVFITGCYTLCNEDLAIVRMQPPVHKDDFGELKTALRTFFHDIHQLGGPALEKIALDYFEEDEEEPEMVAQEIEEEDEMMAQEGEEPDMEMEEKEDSDLEMLDGPTPVFMTPKKKRVVKVKEKLDDEFLRHSKRVSQKLGGFKDADSARKHKEAEGEKKKPNEPKKARKPKGTKKTKKSTGATAEADVDEPVPLVMIPSAGTEIAPHHFKEVLEGIGQGFLQIQPTAISAALLDNDDLDD